MKMFVGFGYNPRDQWMQEGAFPIVKIFGDEVVTCKELYGQQISHRRLRFRKSDTMILLQHDLVLDYPSGSPAPA